MATSTNIHLPDPEWGEAQAEQSFKMYKSQEEGNESKTIALSIEDAGGNDVGIFINTQEQAYNLLNVAQQIVGEFL